MSANTAPIFTLTPKCAMAALTAANTNRDGTGTVATVFTAGTNGSRIEHIDIVAQITVAAGVVRLFIYDGTNYRLWREVLITATTPSTTVAVFRTSIDCSTLPNVLILPSGYSLRASTNNGGTEVINVIAVGGDY